MLRQATWIRASWEPQPDEYTDFLLSFAVTEGKHYELLLACDTDYALYEGDKLLAFGPNSLINHAKMKLSKKPTGPVITAKYSVFAKEILH